MKVRRDSCLEHQCVDHGFCYVCRYVRYLEHGLCYVCWYVRYVEHGLCMFCSLA